MKTWEIQPAKQGRTESVDRQAFAIFMRTLKQAGLLSSIKVVLGKVALYTLWSPDSRFHLFFFVFSDKMGSSLFLHLIDETSHKAKALGKKKSVLSKF